MNTVVNVARAKDGRTVTVREIVVGLGNDLMRTDGLRVVSAWNNLPKISVPPDATHPDQFFIELQASVRRDIGAERAEVGLDAYWSYAPYVALCRSFGEQWPVEALAAYLRLFDWTEVTAQRVWERAVHRYDHFKFMDGA
jgi:hypothetical protein